MSMEIIIIRKIMINIDMACPTNTPVISSIMPLKM
jgi:hypothetical protein